MKQAFYTAFTPGSTPYFYLLWGLFIGILLAFFYTVLQRVTVGQLIRALKKQGASTASTAQTLSALGLSKRFYLHFLLAHDRTLRKMVFLAPRVENPAGNPLDADSAKPTGAEKAEKSARNKEKQADTATAMEKYLPDSRLYLPEETSYRAEAFYARRDYNPILLVLVPVVLFGILIALFWVIPKLI